MSENKKPVHFSTTALDDLYTIFRQFNLEVGEIERIIDRGPRITFEKIIELTKNSINPVPQPSSTQPKIKLRVLRKDEQPF